MTTTTLNTLLATIPHRERYRSLTAWLIRYLRQSQMDMPSHLQDIISHGCVSGVIPKLIYNPDCIRFYTRFQDQIWEKINDYLESTGENFGELIQRLNYTVCNDKSLKVALVWFAVEQTAYALMCELLPY